MTGRPPVPTELKIIRGTDRANRTSTNEPKPERSIPSVPTQLSDEAKVEWGRMSEKLYQLGLLSEIDRAALAAYCQAWADFVEAREKVGQLGKVIKTGEKVLQKVNGDIERSGGSFFENPYYSIQKRSMELMHKFLVEFGMSPSSRTRIDIEKAGGVPRETRGTGKGEGRWADFKKA